MYYKMPKKPVKPPSVSAKAKQTKKKKVAKKGYHYMPSGKLMKDSDMKKKKKGKY